MAEDKAKVEEKANGQGITVQLSIPEKSIERALDDGVRNQLMAGAVGYLVEKLTPEVVRDFSVKLINESLRDLHSYTFRQEVGKLVAPMISEALSRPENVAFIRRAVDEGIIAAIKDIPEEVRKKVVERALTGLAKSWER